MQPFQTFPFYQGALNPLSLEILRVMQDAGRPLTTIKLEFLLEALPGYLDHEIERLRQYGLLLPHGINGALKTSARPELLRSPTCAGDMSPDEVTRELSLGRHFSKVYDLLIQAGFTGEQAVNFAGEHYLKKDYLAALQTLANLHAGPLDNQSGHDA
jgi:hypothetical protein